MKNIVSSLLVLLSVCFIAVNAHAYTQPNDTVIDGRKCFMVKTAAEAGRKSGLLPKFQGDKNTKYDLYYKVVKHPYVFEDDNTVAHPGEFVISTSGKSVGTLSDTLMLPCYGQNRLSATEFKNPAPYRFMRIDDYTRADSCKINEVLIGYGYPLAGNYSHFDSIRVYFGPVFNDSVCPAFSNCKFITGTKRHTVRYDCDSWSCKYLYYDAVKLPNTIKSIPQDAFRSTMIEGLDLPDTINSIGLHAFENTEILEGNLAIPNGITTIENSFQNCRISGIKSGGKISIPSSVTEIKEGAFYRAYATNGPIISKNLRIVRKKAFMWFRVWYHGSWDPFLVPTINLGDSLTVVEDSAFLGVKIRITELPTTLKVIGKRAFYCSYTEGSVIKNLSQVDTIGDEAFASNSAYDHMPSLNIHISKSPLRWGQGVFKDCWNLNAAFFNEECTEIHIPDYTFMNCKYLIFIGIDQSGKSLNNVIHKSFKSIGNYAFYNCPRFDVPDFPENMEFIGKYAFYNCDIVSTEFKNDRTRIGEGAFSNCRLITKCILPKQMTEIPDYLFFHAGEKTMQRINVIMPDAIRKIGKSAFAFCCKLDSLQLPRNLTEIADSAFFNSYLSHLEFNPDLKKIGNYALAKNLFSDVHFPDSVTHVGKGVFEGCDSLTSVSFPKDMQQMDCDRMFDGCIKLRQIIFNFDNPEIMQNMQDLFGDRTASDTEYHSPVIIHVPYGCLSKFSELQRLFDFVIVKEMNPDGSTSVDDVKDADMNPFVLDGDMSLKNAAGMHVTVFSVDGRTVFSTPAYNGEPLPLTRKKLYLISINGTTSKIIP